MVERTRSGYNRYPKQKDNMMLPVYDIWNSGQFIKDLAIEACYETTDREANKLAFHLASQQEPSRHGTDGYKKRLASYRAKRPQSEVAKIEAIKISADTLMPDHWQHIKHTDCRVVSKLAHNIYWDNHDKRTKGPGQIIIPRWFSTTDTTKRDSGLLTIDPKTVTAHADIPFYALSKVHETVLLESLVHELRSRIEYLVINGSGSGQEPRGILTDTQPDAQSKQRLGYPELAKKIKNDTGRWPDCFVFTSDEWCRFPNPYSSIRRPVIASPEKQLAPVGSMFGANCYISDYIADKHSRTEVLAFNRRNLFIAESSSTPTIIAKVLGNTQTIRFTASCFLWFGSDRQSVGVLQRRS